MSIHLTFYRLVVTLGVILVGMSIPTVPWADVPLRAVIIVRHGEKATAPLEDPPLSPAGQARAQALLETLRDAGLTAILTTQQLRTRETGAPLVTGLHLQSIVVPTSPDPREHARAVAAAVRQAGGTVLVIDHQLTIPLIIAALGGPSVRIMCDVEFSNLYLLMPADATRMELLRMHYGALDPPHGEGCHISPVSPP
ncbi:MAG TPA: phosphoglycerate mutase family protein [Gammaproteobacteria bacterium]|jgi:broad specificity phosphatase PhoE|nr:phosphoglycerate mutase family protein [Gammaproteobacteria bacterium]